ncbi:DUF2510 domain-containing protein [Streptomyces sp. VRA16 Mangrove soil]|uniref:DUF2510 domain-containing protein n=1 Tax=Streptomyces sp. VRA16 Mangrove soil TaxID=2817434 RepID=UPI001A9E70C6|nr:DUF2510 domain-containing protein [Streptomyces sp. VRA16 Mangrove soil]MBO1330841.1 DUF2510 domain-containing protein [Streptomyces sp. VRA16 Mangrove soil]
MTSQTPAGWYPDPGQVQGGPRTERWWDGGRWTEQTRPATTPPPHPPQDAVRDAGPGPEAGAEPGTDVVPAPVPAPAPVPVPLAQAPTAPGNFPAYPNYPAYPSQLPPKPRSKARIAIAAAIAVAVLAGIGGGVYALTSGGDDKSDTTDARSQQPGPPGFNGGGSGGQDGGQGAGPSPETPDQSPQAPLDQGYATDLGNGIALPVLDGWSGSDGMGAAGVQTGSYSCPDDSGKECVRGGASSASAKALKLDATTAEAAAKEDIAKNAKASYGGKTYGGITGHKVLASEKVTVAGKQGYQVRWKVETKSGYDAWVESVVAPSPVDADSLVVIRLGVDVPRTAKEKAAGPDDSAIDKIVKGIKESDVTGGSGGSGQGV